jgi:hypothetical protein
VTPELRTVHLSEIIFREDLYPRIMTSTELDFGHLARRPESTYPAIPGEVATFGYVSMPACRAWMLTKPNSSILVRCDTSNGKDASSIICRA